jgi:hypothetical protein
MGSQGGAGGAERVGLLPRERLGQDHTPCDDGFQLL